MQLAQDHVETLRGPGSVSVWTRDCTVPSSFGSDLQVDQEPTLEGLPIPLSHSSERGDSGTAITAPDLATFLRHLLDFMPAVILTSEGSHAGEQSCQSQYYGGDPKLTGTSRLPDIHTDKTSITRQQSSESLVLALKHSDAEEGWGSCSPASCHPSHKISTDGPSVTCCDQGDDLPSPRQQLASSADIAAPITAGCSPVSIPSTQQQHEVSDIPLFSIVSPTRPLMPSSRPSNPLNATGIRTTAFQSAAIPFFTPEDKFPLP